MGTEGPPTSLGEGTLSMKTVWILGESKNLHAMPDVTPAGVEVWAVNNPQKYGRQRDRVKAEYTRWFNLHSRRWMLTAYPKSFAWHLRQDGSRRFYTQRVWDDIPGCRAFPRKRIQKKFRTAASAMNRYFTCSVCWLIAFAILEGFERIELWGFTFADKPGARYAHQRPCFFYWVDQARKRGLEVTYQKGVQLLPHIAGDPDAYNGPLYGYDTRPEKGPLYGPEGNGEDARP